MNVKDMDQAVREILELYDQIATGETQGAGGIFYADGKGTLNAITVPVALLERLAEAAGRKVHPRTHDYRNSINPQK